MNYVDYYIDDIKKYSQIQIIYTLYIMVKETYNSKLKKRKVYRTRKNSKKRIKTRKNKRRRKVSHKRNQKRSKHSSMLKGQRGGTSTSTLPIEDADKIIKTFILEDLMRQKKTLRSFGFDEDKELHRAYFFKPNKLLRDEILQPLSGVSPYNSTGEPLKALYDDLMDKKNTGNLRRLKPETEEIMKKYAEVTRVTKNLESSRAGIERRRGERIPRQFVVKDATGYIIRDRNIRPPLDHPITKNNLDRLVEGVKCPTWHFSITAKRKYECKLNVLDQSEEGRQKINAALGITRPEPTPPDWIVEDRDGYIIITEEETTPAGFNYISEEDLDRLVENVECPNVRVGKRNYECKLNELEKTDTGPEMINYALGIWDPTVH